MDDRSRRRFLAASSSGILGGLAGCSGGELTNLDSSENPSDQATDEQRRIAELEQKVAEKDQRIRSLEQRLHELETEDFEDSVLKQAEQLGRQTRESVVVSIASSDRTSSTGTAWFIDDNRLVTTGHGAGRVESLTCWTVDGESFTASIIDSIHGDFQEYSHLDLTVLETEFTGTPLPTGSSESLTADQLLVQVGHPSAVGNWVTSLGKFADKHRFYGLRSTVPTANGNSGSPVLTLDGTVVGLTTGNSPRKKLNRQDGEAPSVAPADVRTSFADTTYANHVPIEAVTAFADQA